MAWGAWIRRHSQVFAAVALIAMAVRAFVPAGYMLAPSAQNRTLTVTLCSGHGPVEAVIDLGPGSKSEKDAPKKSAAGDGPCVFAVTAAFAAPATALTLAADLQVIKGTPKRAFYIAPGRGLAAPPPWATGPPANA